MQPYMEKLYTISKNKTECWLWVRTWTPYCQIRLDLKRVGKTTRPFRYDLNQIPCNYTVEVTDRLKGLDLIERLKNYGRRFVTLYKMQWSRPSPRWHIRRTCTHLLLWKLQNYNLLLNSCWQQNVGSKERPQKDGRRGEITFRFRPHTCQRHLEGSNKPCAHQDPKTPETEPEPCLSAIQNLKTKWNHR